MASRSSSRQRITRAVFDPSLGPTDYTRQNLRGFIDTAGPQAVTDYNRELATYKQQLQQDLAGRYNLSGDQLGRQIIGTRGASGEYQRGIQQFTYDFVRGLSEEGRLGELQEGQARPAPAHIVNVAEVQTMLNAGTSQEDILDTLFSGDINPAGFRINALDALARGLNIPVANIRAVPGTGDEKKMGLINLILTSAGRRPAFTGQQLAPPASTTGPSSRGRSRPVTDTASLMEDLNSMGVTSSLDLLGLTAVQLRDLARRHGIIAGTNKATAASNIARTVGFAPPPTAAEARSIVRDITDIAKGTSAQAERAVADLQARGANIPEGIDATRGSNAAAALTIARGIHPELLRLLSLAEIQALATALAINRQIAPRGKPSKEAVISFITGQQSAVSRSREVRKSIRTSKQGCNSATLSEVRKVAEDLKIPYTDGTSQAALCDRIYGHHLRRVSELILRRGRVGIDNLIAMQPQAQVTALHQLSSNLGLNNPVNTVPDLLNAWMYAHYVGRAMDLYPAYSDAVDAYLQSGTVPNDPKALDALAVVFSDINRNLYSLRDTDALDNALQGLYQHFITRLKDGDVDTFLRDMGRFSFEIEAGAQEVSPAPQARAVSPRQPSPVRALGGVPSPRGQVSPRAVSPRQVPSAAGSPLSSRGASPRRTFPSPRQPSPFRNPDISNAQPSPVASEAGSEFAGLDF